MGRPKGLKNKVTESKKQDVKPDVVSNEKENKEDSITITAPNTKKVKSATTYSEMWTPKPDMGNIVPPPDSDDICECTHKKIMHYGSQHNWCNEQNCRCSAWSKE